MADNACAIVDVVEFEVQDYVTRNLLFSVDYATSVGLNTDADKLDIRGGPGMPIRITAHHTRNANFTSELPLVDINALGVKLGKKVVTAAATAPKSEKLIVDASNTVTLKETPLSKTLKVYVLEANGRDPKNELKVGTPATKVDEYSITNKVITVNTAVTKGTLIKVLYDYTTSAGAQLARLTANDFPKYCRITGTGYRLDESGNNAPVSFIVYRCSPDTDFEIIFKGGEATNITFNGTMSPALVGTDNTYFDIIYLPVETAEESGGS